MTNSPVPTLSSQEAQALINHAQSAPLQNMVHASEISILMQKFQAWYAHVTAEVESFETRVATAVKEAEDKVRAEFSPPEKTDTPS